MAWDPRRRRPSKVTLFDVLPSLKGVTVARSFDPTSWRLPIHTQADDILVGERSLREESRQRKVAFYLDVDGKPTCQSLCPASMLFPALVTRVTAAHHTAGRATLHIDTALPLTAVIADLAIVGHPLCGASMSDVTIVDTAGHRRTVHAELPANVAATSTVVLALGWVEAHLPTQPAVSV